MKYIYIILAILCLCSFSEKKLPEKVKRSFDSKYPDVESVKWKKSNGCFVAKSDGLINVFEPDGTVIYTCRQMSADKLIYEGYKINKISYIRTPSDTFYYAKATKDHRDYDLYLTKDLKLKEGYKVGGKYDGVFGVILISTIIMLFSI